MSPTPIKPAVAYYRVSTKAQGVSGLGLEAQRAAVERYAEQAGYHLAHTFVEVESGKNSDRPQFTAAVQYAKDQDCTLIVAKLDRLSRRVSTIATLMESHVRFVVADMPEANELTIHIYAVLAQYELKLISERIKAALAAAKRRGTLLGAHNPKIAAALDRSRSRQKRVNPALPVALELRSQGLTLDSIANVLNKSGFRTARGGLHTKSSICRMIKP